MSAAAIRSEYGRDAGGRSTGDGGRGVRGGPRGRSDRGGPAGAAGVRSGDGPDEADRIAGKLERLRVRRRGGTHESLGAGHRRRAARGLAVHALRRRAQGQPSGASSVLRRRRRAEPLYERVRAALGAQGGVFGAGMEVSSVNDGPVTSCWRPEWSAAQALAYTRGSLGLSSYALAPCRSALRGGLRSPPFFLGHADRLAHNRHRTPLATTEPQVEVLAREQVGRERLRLFIDHPQGVDLGLCERVDAPPAGSAPRLRALEVSSPGPERPLTKPDHFRRSAGVRARACASRGTATRASPGSSSAPATTR